MEIVSLSAGPVANFVYGRVQCLAKLKYAFGALHVLLGVAPEKISTMKKKGKKKKHSDLGS